MKKPSLRLVHAVIGKSIIEALLVGILAIVFFVDAFPPYFRGWGEITPDGVFGWAVNSAQKDDRVEVQLFVDGKFVASGSANQYRPDVRAALWAKDDWHGYSFKLPTLAPGKHVAAIYGLHMSGGGRRQTLQLLGNTMSYLSDQDGHITPLEKPRTN
jgi:hypothetical protein